MARELDLRLQVGQEKGEVLKMEGVDFQVQVWKNHTAAAVLEAEKSVLFFHHHIVLEEAKNIRGLEEGFHNLAVAFVARVVGHLLGSLWEVEEGVSNIVEVGVDCIAGSRNERMYCCHVSAILFSSALQTSCLLRTLSGSANL